MEEIELKFLDINKEEIIKKILSLGAEKKYESEAQSVYYDNDSLKIEFWRKGSDVLRLRKVDGKNFLTHKSHLPDKTVKARQEYETEVENYEEMQNILSALGFKPIIDYEKKRTHFELKDVHFEIDELEGLPPFLEVETHSVEKMKEICEKLDLEFEKGSSKSLMGIYPEFFKKTTSA